MTMQRAVRITISRRVAFEKQMKHFSVIYAQHFRSVL